MWSAYSTKTSNLRCIPNAVENHCTASATTISKFVGAQLQLQSVPFQVWDLGGQANLRPSWATYYRSTDAVIVVIDSTDRARASIAKASVPASCQDACIQASFILLEGYILQAICFSTCLCELDCMWVLGFVKGFHCTPFVGHVQNELFNLLDHEHLSEAAILIMANKQDLKDAMTVKEMSDVLALHTIKRHDWHIQVLSDTISFAYHLSTNLLGKHRCRNPSHIMGIQNLLLG